jgi:hypothetical protein
VANIKIEGIPPWDGVYELDLTYFTNRELHQIKVVSDVRAGELSSEFARGNNDLVVAVAAIALKRNGKEVPIDELWDAPVGKIVLEDDAEVEDVDPPSPTSNVNGLPDVGNVQPDPSGPSSNGSSDDPLVTNPVSIGLHG